ncbi:MAG: 6-pyruvoyl trahydropterin synthase family protein, partial [Gemmataceae bacterium]
LGMVMDFSRLKQTLGKWIDDHLDHRMILHRNDPALEYLRSQGEPVFVMDVNPTAESIAKLIFDQAKSLGFPVVEVKLWETASCYAAYKP